MIKDILDNNEITSANEREITMLKEYFPACFSEDGSFDIERFKEYISEKLDVKNEGYELTFLGKNYARLLASIDTTTVVTPDTVHNEKTENKDSENLYITGDNLDGLKHLLKSYTGKIKCIYIDPPYNTGSDGFVYSDRFDFTVEDLTTKLSISESQSQRILDLTRRGSASHSAWLMFMYPRLQLARDLLSEDGVILISIDDNEQANLKLICDDVFGEENFVGIISVLTNPKGRSQDQYLAKCNEFLLIYTMSDQPKGRFNIGKTHKELIGDYNLKDDSGNLYREIELRNTHREFGKHNRPNLFYPLYVDGDGTVSLIKTEQLNIEVYPYWSDGFEGCWTWDSSKSQESISLLHARKIRGTWKVYRKDYAFKDGAPSTKMLKSIWNDKSFRTEAGQKRFNDLFATSEKYFEAPKPVNLIVQCIKMSHADIILDFFSGSATTADAVMQLNAEDGGNRKFIMVQLPEIIEENKPAYKAGYRTIDEIGRERIIRAAKKIKDENPDTTADLGFKHYFLEEPSGKQLSEIIDFDRKANELVVKNNLVEEFGTDTVLTTWLIRDGYGFSPKFNTINFGNYTGYHMDKHLYLIHKGLDNDAIEAIVSTFDTDPDFNPENVVLFGYSFTWTEMESLQTNLKRLKATEKNLRINFDIRY